MLMNTDCIFGFVVDITDKSSSITMEELSNLGVKNYIIDEVWNDVLTLDNVTLLSKNSTNEYYHYLVNILYIERHEKKYEKKLKILNYYANGAEISEERYEALNKVYKTMFGEDLDKSNAKLKYFPYTYFIPNA